MKTTGVEVPSVIGGKNFQWDVPLKRVTSFGVTGFSEEIEYLKKENRTLRYSLARKYQHCNKLKDEVRELNRLVHNFNDDVLCSQSGVATTNSEPGLTVSESTPMVAEQITAFADQDAGWTTEIHGDYDATRDAVAADNSNLGQFLGRPIRQSVQSWKTNQPFYYEFNPWAEFLQNPFVADKIKNYELIRMKMHCKMVISGTKFHYGRALASYNPVSGFDQITVERNFLTQDLIQASQKPHFFLNPTKNTGGELSMPFFWNRNYLSLTDEDYDQMGEITIKSFGNLLHANGGNDPITVTIYLWAEDVVLTMPTSVIPLPSQAGKKGLSKKNKGNSITSNDEYGSGIISKPAALVAKAAGVLSEMPLIRPYALATQMVAGKIGEFARLFGYSRPSVVSDIQLFKPNPTGNFTNVDAADAVHKLTLDSKAEITVDSRVAGLDGTDQMGILDIAQRESYLTQFTWAPDAGPDTLLWNSRATPMLFDILGTEIHPTPMAMLAQCFDVWNGSVKFRFQIVKSDFHKGRLLVRYDPNRFDSAVEYNTNYSRVVDIAEEDDFEIVVGWAQAQAWLQCGTLSDFAVNFSDSVRLSQTQGLYNGILEIDVLNDLVCPAEDTPISINVFVSMCEDAKFAAPSNEKLNNFHVFRPPETALSSQSGMMGGTANSGDTMTDRPTGSSEIQPIGSKGKEADNTYAVWYGDPPTTIRELCKRYTQTKVWVPAPPEEGFLSISTLLNKDAPYQSGWDPEGINVSDVDGTTRLNVVNKDYASWWTPCYAGVRGARRKKYLFSNGASTNPNVVRGNYTRFNNGIISQSTLNFVTTAPERLSKWASTRICATSGAGASATNFGVNNTIEVEFPFYADERFRGARNVRAQTLPSNSHLVTTTATTSDPAGRLAKENSFSTTYQQWDAVGEDFTLMFFTGAPIMYKYRVREFT